MHCKSCVVLTESELRDHDAVEHVVADLNTCCVEVHGDFGDKGAGEVADMLSPLLERHGYKLSTEREVKNSKWAEFGIAVPLALGITVLFILLQKLGIVNLIGAGTVTYGTAFTIGIIASLSTCMAVVGGLVLSMSATFARKGDRIKPQVMFHIGRLVSFFVLGGVIGAIGATFTLNTSATFILNIIIGLVMLILGINLLDVFHWSKRLLPSMPKWVARYAHSITKLNHSLAPLLIGVATFFLPCGFTQSMQLYTLSTGSFIKGALTMLVFALGTLPVLALVGFSSFSIKSGDKAGVFFKTAGLVVIVFAIFNLINGLVVIGLVPPIFNF